MIDLIDELSFKNAQYLDTINKLSSCWWFQKNRKKYLYYKIDEIREQISSIKSEMKSTYANKQS